MKRITLLLITALILVSCSSEERYVIKGKIEGSDGFTFYLKIRQDEHFIDIDSAVSKRGSFKMKGGAVEYPQLAVLAVGYSNIMTSFYLENSKITIKGSLDSLFTANITGSKTHDEYQSFIESNEPLSAAYQALYVEFMEVVIANNEERLAEILMQVDSIENEMINKQKTFIIQNPSSFITPALLIGLSNNIDADELELYINNLDTLISNQPIIKTLKARVAAARSVEIGAKAPDFTLNDVKGDTLSLYSKIGAKALLIDFWAAWCGPCRLENPNIVKTYKEFNKKGFEIIGVSLDRNKEDWLQAIDDDKLDWTNVFGTNSVAALYSINAIPANFLLDTNGIIIAKNLRGEDLYNKIKEVLEKK